MLFFVGQLMEGATSGRVRISRLVCHTCGDVQECQSDDVVADDGTIEAHLSCTVCHDVVQSYVETVN